MDPVTSSGIGRGRGRGRGKVVREPQFQNPRCSTPPPQAQAVQLTEIETVPEHTSSISRGRGRGRGRGVLVSSSAILRSETVAIAAEKIEQSPMTIITPSGRGRGKGGLGQRAFIVQKEDSHLFEEPAKSCTSEAIVKKSKELSSPTLSEVIISKSNYETLEEDRTTHSLPEEKLPISCFFPKYFEAPQPSKRLQNMKSCEVKLLDVLDNGTAVVAFQDENSRKRFSTLLNLMKLFYATPEGQKLVKPFGFLEIGEIVGASVHNLFQGNSFIYRRVKIHRLIDEGDCITAIGLDIDNSRFYYLNETYVLPEHFIMHPRQACPVQIFNLENFCSMEVLRDFLKDSDSGYIRKITKKIAIEVLRSRIGERLFLTKISSAIPPVGEEVQEWIQGEFDTRINWNIESHFMEEFCNYFQPNWPKVGSEGTGIIADIKLNADIIICPDGGLYHVIDSMINSQEIWELAFNISKEDQNKLLKKIKFGECNYVVVLNFNRTKLLRARILNSSENAIKVHLIDVDNEAVIITTSQLVCQLSDISPILPSIPPQAVCLHLNGNQVAPEKFSRSLRGIPVEFEVVSCGLKGLLQVEVYNRTIHPPSINDYLKECTSSEGYFKRFRHT